MNGRMNNVAAAQKGANLTRGPKMDCTIKGGSRRAEKIGKVLMMMKAAKLGWAGAGPGAGAGKKQGWTKNRVRKGRSRAGAGQK